MEFRRFDCSHSVDAVSRLVVEGVDVDVCGMAVCVRARVVVVGRCNIGCCSTDLFVSIELIIWVRI